MNKKNIFAVALAIAALLPVCISCSEHADEETPMNETKKQTVSIQTRTADGTPAIDWPLTLYAFNSSGNLVTSTTANDDTCSTGRYHFAHTSRNPDPEHRHRNSKRWNPYQSSPNEHHADNRSKR